MALLFLCEAFLEKYVIALKNPDHASYPYLDKKEHAWSLAYSILLCAAIAIVTKQYWLFPSLLASRRIWFDYPLKIIRGKPFREIQGKGWFDRTSRSIFGVKGGLMEAIAIILFKSVYLTFSLL